MYRFQKQEQSLDSEMPVRTLPTSPFSRLCLMRPTPDLNYDSKSSCKLDESSDSWLSWNRVLAKLDNTNLRIGLIATTTMTDTTLLML
uniref:Uncharacterized protein n=1 Tax=Vitis vinifera TaxID=29760 RepID=A5B7R1_VITVI|nr:hypothetical protein VITISV_020090 [Vitis vinifera]